MVNNYCPFCGRFMQMREFEHACDQTAVLRGEKTWCSKCGAPMKTAQDDYERALCARCQNRITEWPKDED